MLREGADLRLEMQEEITRSLATMRVGYAQVPIKAPKSLQQFSPQQVS